jgi:monovalent cation:H+ antiporter-2, CPA2 family
MHGHEAELLTTTLLMLSAIGCGLILKFVRQPPLVGYILAGLFIGPSGLGLIDYSAEISSLAELGIILLLFIICMELSVKAFLSVVRPAVIATIAQIMCSIFLAFLVSFYFAWSVPQILLVGFILTLLSTAVALMMLDSLGLCGRMLASSPLACLSPRISLLCQCWYLPVLVPGFWQSGRCW